MRHIKLLILSIIFGSVLNFFVSTRQIVLCFIAYCLKQQAFCLGVFILSKYKYVSSLPTGSPLCDIRERYEAKLGQEMGCGTCGKKKKRPKCLVLILPRGRFPRIRFGDRCIRLQPLCATDLHVSTGHDMNIEERKGKCKYQTKM